MTKKAFKNIYYVKTPAQCNPNLPTTKDFAFLFQYNFLNLLHINDNTGWPGKLTPSKQKGFSEIKHLLNLTINQLLSLCFVSSLNS